MVGYSNLGFMINSHNSPFIQKKTNNNLSIFKNFLFEDARGLEFVFSTLCLYFMLVYTLYIFTSLCSMYSSMYITRLLGRFAPIFYLNCEHVLFVNILNKEEKIFADLKKKFFFTKLKTFKTHLFIFIIHKPFLWSREVPQKIWARSVQPFWRLLDTNRQTDKQTDKPNLYIDSPFDRNNFFFLSFLWKIP